MKPTSSMLRSSQSFTGLILTLLVCFGLTSCHKQERILAMENQTAYNATVMFVMKDPGVQLVWPETHDFFELAEVTSFELEPGERKEFSLGEGIWTGGKIDYSGMNMYEARSIGGLLYNVKSIRLLSNNGTKEYVGMKKMVSFLSRCCEPVAEPELMTIVVE